MEQGYGRLRTPQVATYHVTSAKLIDRFTDLEDNEYRMSTDITKAYEVGELEQPNVLSDLMAPISLNESYSSEFIAVNRENASPVILSRNSRS